MDAVVLGINDRVLRMKCTRQGCQIAPATPPLPPLLAFDGHMPKGVHFWMRSETPAI